MADTPEKARIGLSGRTYLAKDSGMLFLSAYPRDIRMWMKDTLIPLDMIFFDTAGQVVHIHKNAKPNDLTVISSGLNVLGVIELKGGRTEELKINVGDKVYLK